LLLQGCCGGLAALSFAVCILEFESFEVALHSLLLRNSRTRKKAEEKWDSEWIHRIMQPF
jgi:hypothetical protein